MTIYFPEYKRDLLELIQLKRRCYWQQDSVQPNNFSAVFAVISYLNSPSSGCFPLPLS